MSNKAWTADETAFLHEHVSAKGPQWCAERLLGRTVGAVALRARRLKLTWPKPFAQWTAAEDALLREHYALRGVAWCVDRLQNRTAYAVMGRVAYLAKAKREVLSAASPWSIGPLVDELYLLGLDMCEIAEKLEVPYNRVKGYLSCNGLPEYRRWYREQQAAEIIVRHERQDEKKAA